MKKQSQASIGRALGLSASSMTKLKGMGMPVDSVQSARSWRECNIAPTMHASAPSRTSQRTQINLKPSERFSSAQSFMRLAASDLADGKCIDSLIPYLRTILADVPSDEREDLLVSQGVMDVLVDGVANCIACDSGDSGGGNKPLSDADAQYMGRFWYRVAAGEIRTNEQP